MVAPKNCSQLGRDRLMGAQRGPEIERKRGLQEVGILHGQRPVQPELFPDALNLLHARFFTRKRQCRVARNHLEQDEHGRHDPEQNRGPGGCAG